VALSGGARTARSGSAAGDAADAARPGAAGGAPRAVGVLTLLALFLFTSYGAALSLVFINDDYVILDKTLHASFASLWAPDLLLFNWYRPVSRELHYWALQRVFGIHELPFHLVSFALWLAGMTLFFTLARRLAGGTVAALATAATAALASWAGPLMWVAGVQELWFFLFAFLFLHAFARRQGAAAALLLALALLSKEPAGVLAPLALLWALLVDRDRPAAAVRRVLPLFVVTAAWAMLHPRLLGRLWGPYAETIESSVRPSLPVTALKTVLALVSLEEIPAPESGFSAALRRGLPSVIALAGIAALAIWAARRSRSASGGPDAAGAARRSAPTRPGPGAAGTPADPAAARRITAFAICWGAIGSVVVFMPSISWHAYYGLFGAFGVWLAIMNALRRRPAIAAALVLAFALLRPLRADTPSWDWASEAFQRRAGYFLRTLRDDLLRRHPDLPAHSRLYFARVPRNIGWVAGNGPAFRVWYGDSTISGGYYSYYRPRRADEAPGRDYFFRFDSSGTWVEVAKGEEDVAAARARNRDWEADHRELALLLGSASDWNGAAEELVKLGEVSPENYEYPLNAAVCYEKLGDSLVAARLYARAASLPGAPEQVKADAARYERLIPPPRKGSVDGKAHPVRR
jgi:hypothetical protein